MIVVRVYTGIPSNGDLAVEACWRALEILRATYGVSVFLEVLDVSLLTSTYWFTPTIIVNDKLIEVDDARDVDELAEIIVGTVLEALISKSRGEVASVLDGYRESRGIDEAMVLGECNV